MYDFIRGKLTHSSPHASVIDAGGIGYKLHIAANAFGKMPQIGDELLLHCSFQVRDNSQALYGFLTVHERDLFELLINVSGVGPKLALSIIGHLPLNDFKQAVAGNEIAKLCRIPGIGKKTAERLIIEIRDKLDMLYLPDSVSSPIALRESQNVSDAMSALIHLGYNQSTAQKAIKNSLADLPDNPELAVLLTHALKNI